MADRYKIYERMGEGGVGAVFRAYDTQLKRWVAIKRLFADPDGGTDSDELRREADSLASLRNSNIVTIFDVASDAEGLFIVMELLEGDDLSSVLEQGPMSFDDFKELANQTLEGLMAAHQLHILHRDIKPENIKVERLPGGRLQSKIIDFGLARAGLKARKQTESLEGTVMGSIFYMAPEQLSRQPVDERGDLYSLGCVFYEALSGKKAFDGASMSDVVDHHLQHQFAPLHTVAIHVPAGLVAWVTKLMALNPDERYASAAEAIEAFRTWEKSPAAMPFGAWTAPMVPTSETLVAGTVTGGANDALAALTAPQRPVATVRSRLPAGGRAAPKQKAHPPAAAVRSSAMVRPKSVAAAGDGAGSKLIPILGGTVLAVVILAWMFLGGDGDDKPAPVKTASSSTKPAPTKAASKPGLVRSDDPYPPLQEQDVCVHYLAEAGVYGEGDKPADVGDKVLKWGDFAPRGGDNPLTALELHPDHAPRLSAWSAAVIKPGVKALDFRIAEGEKPKQLWHTATAIQLQAFPKSREPVRGGPGATMAVVFQATGGKNPQRVFFLGGEGGQSLVLRVDGKNEVFAVASMGKPRITVQAAGVNGNWPTVAVVRWTVDGELTLRASNGNGKTAQKKASGRPMRHALSRIEAGRCFNPNGDLVNPNEQFRGMMAEVIVYSSALDDAQMKELETSLRERYFVKP